jgi:hypothetical protein
MALDPLKKYNCCKNNLSVFENDVCVKYIHLPFNCVLISNEPQEIGAVLKLVKLFPCLTKY